MEVTKVIFDSKYSTTRNVIQFDRLSMIDVVKVLNKPDDKFETVLYLPEGENRQGEGGLRKQGYFKKSCDDRPLITIVTVVYNGEQFLEKTILSVINQIYDNVEYVIIDGGSTDGTLDIIKKYEHAIDYWVSEKDSGIYDAMNKGIDLAMGDWINFMNGGDVFFSYDVLEKIFCNSFSKKIKILYGDVETDYGQFQVKHKAGKLEKLKFGMQFSHQSTFFKTEYHKSNKYNLSYELSSDFYVIFNAYLKGSDKFNYFNEVIAIVNIDGVSERKIYKSVTDRWRVVRKSKSNTYDLKIYYTIKISIQYFKVFILGSKLLSIYRRLKFRGKL